MTTTQTTQAGERTLCPNCGHDQDGEHPTHCLSCAWPVWPQTQEEHDAEEEAIERTLLGNGGIREDDRL